jgi:hypothetical protein
MHLCEAIALQLGKGCIQAFIEPFEALFGKRRYAIRIDLICGIFRRQSFIFRKDFHANLDAGMQRSLGVPGNGSDLVKLASSQVGIYDLLG